MARNIRIEYPGALYHIFTKGNRGQSLFLTDRNSLDFLHILSDVSERYNWNIYAYCLMDNHYHLLVETVDGILSHGMRNLNSRYTQKFNQENRMKGHLFQGRYKAILVQKEDYLLELVRYILLNPVRAGMVKTPDAYGWSSYSRTLAGKDSALLKGRKLLSFFDQKPKAAKKIFVMFIAEKTSKRIPYPEAYQTGFLGSEIFIEQAMKHSKGAKRHKVVTKKQRFADRPSLEKLFTKVTNRSRRNKLIYNAHVKHGYLLKEISSFLGLHYSTVSKAFIAHSNSRRKKFLISSSDPK